MTVQIDFEHSNVFDNGRGGFLVLANPEADHSYASWPYHVDGEDGHYVDGNVWTWENPDSDLREITLSPSLRYTGTGGPQFHIFIRDGEIEHCGDCQCGCGSD